MHHRPGAWIAVASDWPLAKWNLLTKTAKNRLKLVSVHESHQGWTISLDMSITELPLRSEVIYHGTAPVFVQPDLTCSNSSFKARVLASVTPFTSAFFDCDT
jgi:hypothetical protein